MNTVTDFQLIEGASALFYGQLLGFAPIIKGDNQLVSIPSVTVGVAQFENNVTGILQRLIALHRQSAISRHGESNR